MINNYYFNIYSFSKRWIFTKRPTKTRYVYTTLAKLRCGLSSYDSALEAYEANDLEVLKKQLALAGVSYEEDC